jgi:uncharacterized protein (DUF885 family)
VRWCIMVVMVTSLVALAQSHPAQQNADTKALHALFDAEWDYSMQQSPEGASELGDRRWNDRWSDESLGAYTRRYAHNREVLADLKKINRTSLSAADQLNYDLFRKNYERAVEGYKFRQFHIP